MKVALLPSGPLRVNTYLAEDEATKKGFIVDPGGFDTNMVTYIAQNKIDLEYIILTHGHEDHIAGVNEYKEMFPNIKVVAHEDEFLIGDVLLDINPIKKEKSGTLKDYIEKMR